MRNGDAEMGTAQEKRKPRKKLRVPDVILTVLAAAMLVLLFLRLAGVRIYMMASCFLFAEGKGAGPFCEKELTDNCSAVKTIPRPVSGSFCRLIERGILCFGGSARRAGRCQAFSRRFRSSKQILASVMPSGVRVSLSTTMGTPSSIALR